MDATEFNTLDGRAQDEELANLIRSPHTYIRQKIRAEIDNCLWADDLQSAYALLHEQMKTITSKYLERCSVCTLPYGTCPHTGQWLMTKTTFSDEIKDSVDNEIDDILDLVGTDGIIETQPDIDDIDINAMRWTQVEIRFSDKIGTTPLSISMPTQRGWHTCTDIGGKFLVVFGGLRYRFLLFYLIFQSLIFQSTADQL